MLWFILAILVGLVALVWSADRFVTGAAGLARTLNVSPLIIGVTIVGFGTSAPEMMVSAFAAWQGATGLAVGNAIGSNIANISLVLGCTALISEIKVRSQTLKREFPALLIITIAASLLLYDGILGRLDGIVMITAMMLVIILVIKTARQGRVDDPLGINVESEIPHHMPLKQGVFWIFIGLIALLASSRLLVWGAVGIAEALGISDLVIGLTIVAIGTSLPELAAAITSALKNEHELAIGNVIGSNMFNILVVLGIAGVINPSTLYNEVLWRDLPVMLVLTLALFAMAYGFVSPGRITRTEGALLLGTFVGYTAFLFTHSA